MEPKKHRQGTLVNLVDKIQNIIQLSQSIKVNQNNADLGYDQEQMENVVDKLRDLRLFDITTIGDLYLTTGGRVVLDRGYGEYFTNGDYKLFTLGELKQGIPYEKFKQRVLNKR